MSAGDLIGGGLSLFDMFSGQDAAEDAADAQKDANKSAIAALLQMFNMGRQDLMPWTNVGKSALFSLADMYGLPGGNMANMGGGGPGMGGGTISSRGPKRLGQGGGGRPNTGGGGGIGSGGGGGGGDGGGIGEGGGDAWNAARSLALSRIPQLGSTNWQGGPYRAPTYGAEPPAPAPDQGARPNPAPGGGIGGNNIRPGGGGGPWFGGPPPSNGGSALAGLSGVRPMPGANNNMGPIPKGAMPSMQAPNPGPGPDGPPADINNRPPRPRPGNEEDNDPRARRIARRDNWTGGHMTPFGQQALQGFRNSPDYQVALREGVNALDSSAAARGNLLSGRQMKAVQDYGQDTATQYFNNYLNRLSGLSGLGQASAAGQAGQAMSAGGSLADLWNNLGNIQASGIMGSQNAQSSGLGNLGGFVGSAFNKLF